MDEVVFYEVFNTEEYLLKDICMFLLSPSGTLWLGMWDTMDNSWDKSIDWWAEGRLDQWSSYEMLAKNARDPGFFPSWI